MKKPVKLLCLVLVLALLGGAYFLLTRNSDEESEEEESTESVSVFLVESDDITALTWTVDGETCSVTRTDGEWESEDGYPLDDTVLDTLADTACAVTAARTVPLDDGGLAEFELDDPAMTITVQTESTSATFYLGLRNPYTDQNYAQLEGQDTVYLLETDLYSTFDLGMLDLVQQEALDDYSTTRTLTIEQDGQTLVLSHPEDNTGLGYSDSFTWFLEDEDGELTALDATNTASLAAVISDLDWVDCVAYEPDSLSEYGLDEPLVTVTIDYDQSEGSATAVLLIGDVAEYEEVTEEESTEDSTQADTEAADSDLAGLLGSLPAEEGDASAEAEDSAAADADGQSDVSGEAEDATQPEALYYYAMLEGGEMVYRLSASDVETILNASAESLLPEDVCLIDWDTLTAMTFTIDGTDYEFLIRRTEEEDEDGNTTETVSCTLNGETVDEADVEDLLDSVTALTAEANTDAEPQTDSDAAITIRFSRDRDTYSVMTMTLTPSDLGFYQVSFAGRTDQLVSLRDVTELTSTVVSFMDSESADATDSAEAE